MTFGAPQFLYLLISLPVLVVFVRWAMARRAVALRRIGDPDLVESLSMASRPLRLVRLVLWFIGVVLVILALSRPQWGSEVEIVEQSGVQLMVALDVSRSMLLQDMTPTRLDRAKLEISDMMSRLKGDAVGIVLFSGASFIQFPLTSDYETARTYLGHAGPGAITRQGTAIGDAIHTASGGFNDQRLSQKVIVIMTDGENHEGDPFAAAQQAAENGIAIYTVGFGSPDGVPVPLYDEQGKVIGYRQDAQGQAIVSQLDEGALRQIAETGGGEYFRASDSGAIADLVDQIGAFQAEGFQSELSQRRIERFQLFLLAGALSFVLAEVLTDRLTSSTRRQWMPAWERE